MNGNFTLTDFQKKDQMFSIHHYTYIPRLFHYACTDYRNSFGTKTGSNDGILEKTQRHPLEKELRN